MTGLKRFPVSCSFEGHTDWVVGAIIRDDGTILSWSRDETLRLWSRDGEPLKVLEGHIERIKGAIIRGDGTILSWSRDGTLRLWSRDGEPLATMGLYPKFSEPLDSLHEISVLVYADKTFVKGFGYGRKNAVTWNYDTGNSKNRKYELKVISVASETARKIASSIKKLKKTEGENLSLYISIRSPWGAEVFSHLSRDVLSCIRGIQVFKGSIYNEIMGFIPELELELLQFTELKGETEQMNIYGLNTQCLQFTRCQELKRVQGSNSAVRKVVIESCPEFEGVEIQGMIEPEVEVI